MQSDVKAPEPGSGRVLSSALACLSLIDTLADSNEPMSVSEIASIMRSAKSSTHQRLQTLIAANWVEQLPDSRYRLTLRPVHLAGMVLKQADLGARVLPAMRALSDETRETVTLYALDGPGPLVIQEVPTDQALKVDVHVGTRMPLDRSAAGRALAAWATREEIEQVVNAGGVLPSEDTISATRHHGYALQEGQMFAGMSSIAVAVSPTAFGSIALAITAPSSRFSLEDLVPPLQKTQQLIRKDIVGGY